VRRFTIAPERLEDGRVVFDRDESHHLARVLRLRPGDTVIAADGAGREYTVRLETVGEEATGSVLGVRSRETESPLRITLVQSVPKGDKMEAIVRAATELGVVRVVPALTARTIVTLEPSRWRDRARRWQRVAKEAAKQCGRAVVPPVEVPRPYADVLALDEPADLQLCLWEGAIGDERSGSVPVATLAATLLASVRRRRHELTILKAIGFERGQLAASIMWQTWAITLIGVAVGIPAGIVVGRSAWRFVADQIGAVQPAVAPIETIASIVAAAALVATVVALVPAWLAARVAPTTALRRE